MLNYPLFATLWILLYPAVFTLNFIDFVILSKQIHGIVFMFEILILHLYLFDSLIKFRFQRT